MAIVTAESELAAMNVVSLVAAATGRWHITERCSCIPVATRAVNAGVPAFERERRRIVIEHRRCPVIAGVAGATLATE